MPDTRSRQLGNRVAIGTAWNALSKSDSVSDEVIIFFPKVSMARLDAFDAEALADWVVLAFFMREGLPPLTGLGPDTPGRLMNKCKAVKVIFKKKVSPLLRPLFNHYDANENH